MAPEFLAARLESTEKLKLFTSFEDARRTGVRSKPVFDYDKLRPGDYLAICSAGEYVSDYSENTVAISSADFVIVKVISVQKPEYRLFNTFYGSMQVEYPDGATDTLDTMGSGRLQAYVTAWFDRQHNHPTLAAFRYKDRVSLKKDIDTYYKIKRKREEYRRKRAEEERRRKARQQHRAEELRRANAAISDDDITNAFRGRG